nr:MAG TPA: hypothetical protein [Bacteriophage sp.]
MAAPQSKLILHYQHQWLHKLITAQQMSNVRMLLV